MHILGKGFIPGTLLLLALWGCGHSRWPSGGRVLMPVQVAERARPATVEIVSEFNASAAVTNLSLDVDKLVSEGRNQIVRGTTTRDQGMEKVLNLFYSDPGRYLEERDRVRLDKKIYALGTGFIVTPDGYILTNAHVVSPEDKDLKQAVLESISQLVDRQTEEMRIAVHNLLPRKDVDAQATERFKDVLTQQYVQHGQFSFSRRVHVILPTARGESVEQAPERPCVIEKAGEPSPGKDIAVLKIDGTDLPTLPVAGSMQSGGVRDGANLYVMGYPGKVSLFPDFLRTSAVQPSLTTGHVSGVKDVSGGWQVIQTDAAINPGNSGGPVLNDQGQVVGLATFQLADAQGLNFAVSIDLAREFLNDLHVDPKESVFTQRYDQALDEYDRPRHGRALPMFRQLAESHPELSGPRDFVRELSSATPEAHRDISAPNHAAGAERRRGHSLLLFLGVGLVLVLGLIALLAAGR